MNQRFRDPFAAPTPEHHVRERLVSASEQAHAERLLQAAALQLASAGSGYTAGVRQESRLVRSGAAGQDAGIPGMGPEPELQHAPGGDLVEGLQHPAFVTIEHLFRVLPNDSWTSIDRNPENPLTFELGAVAVPSGQIFLITDYEFVALRQSGLDPFDFVAAEPYRFSGFMGFFLSVGGRVPNNLFYQLDPAPQQFQRQSFDPTTPPGPGFAPAQQRQFNVNAANSFGSVSGQGTALLPVRPNVQGPRNQPFTIVGQAGDRVSLSCTIFRRIMAPLAGIQASVSGYKIHQQTMAALLNRVRPR